MKVKKTFLLIALISLVLSGCNNLTSSINFEVPEETLDEYKEAFDGFDVDGNGSIDKEELAQALTKFGYAKSELECQAMIDAVDISKDGKVQYDEFIKLMTQGFQRGALAEAALKAFEYFDKRGTGRMSMSEFKYICTQLGIGLDEPFVQQVIKKANLEGAMEFNYRDFVQNWK